MNQLIVHCFSSVLIFRYVLLLIQEEGRVTDRILTLIKQEDWSSRKSVLGSPDVRILTLIKLEMYSRQRKGSGQFNLGSEGMPLTMNMMMMIKMKKRMTKKGMKQGVSPVQCGRGQSLVTTWSLLHLKFCIYFIVNTSAMQHWLQPRSPQITF